MTTWLFENLIAYTKSVQAQLFSFGTRFGGWNIMSDFMTICVETFPAYYKMTI
jgi:hypothetical protein